MTKQIVTVKDAAHEWVGQFNAIPQSIIIKLMAHDEDAITEVTPPGKGDKVYIWDGEYDGEYGEIIESRYDGEDDLYLVKIDGMDEDAVLSRDEFNVQYDDGLPMWGTMWSFDDSCDNWWLEKGEGLQKMADCGFRIYEQEDFGFIFGIDGAGYSFFEEHWVPLYKARGLHWHDEGAEEAE